MSEKKQPLEEHLVQVLERLIKLQPEDPLKFFPLVSNSIRTGKFVPDKKTSYYAPQANLFSPLEKIKESLEEQKKFLDYKKPPPKKEKKEGEEGEPEPEPEEASTSIGIPDVVNEFQYFQLSGISLTNEEIQAIVASAKKIMEEKPKKYTSLRFFGRIFGIKKNYYIIECVPIIKEEGDEPPAEDNPEGAAASKKPKPVDPQGINKFKYLVSVGSPLSSSGWTELPDTTPEFIQASRLIFNFFTGDLEESVKSQPPFPGKEKDYLRAQIERISCSTCVCPSSIFKLENEEPEEDSGEEGAPKKKKQVKEIEAYKVIPNLVKNEKLDVTQNLQDLSNWVHVRPTILQSQGRCTYFDPNAKPGEEEVNEDDLSEEEKAKRPKKNIEMIWPILAPLDLEKPVQKEFSETGNWVSRLVQPSVASNIVCLRSLTWPGAFSVAKINQTKQTIDFSNIYLGNGLKSKKYAKIKLNEVQ